jgi:hypothetical protein
VIHIRIYPLYIPSLVLYIIKIGNFFCHNYLYKTIKKNLDKTKLILTGINCWNLYIFIYLFMLFIDIRSYSFIIVNLCPKYIYMLSNSKIGMSSY